MPFVPLHGAIINLFRVDRFANPDASDESTRGKSEQHKPLTVERGSGRFETAWKEVEEIERKS
jgi:hypothetical protein